MDDIAPFLEHHQTFLRTMGAGLAGILIPLIGGAPAVLRHLGAQTAFGGAWRPYSPNWITVYSLLGTAAGAGIYFAGHPALGIFLACFAGILDRLDGRMAHVMGRTLDPPSAWKRTADGTEHAVERHPDGGQGTTILFAPTAFSRLWHEMNFAGGTDLGKVLDPAFDKVKNVGLLAAFAALGYVSPWLLLAMAVPELLGTLMRRPFFLLARFQKEPKATAIGKWKALLQWLAIILCAPFHQGWVADGWSDLNRGYLLNGLLAGCVLLSWMSVLSRLSVVRQSTLGGTLAALDGSMGHD